MYKKASPTCLLSRSSTPLAHQLSARFPPLNSSIHASDSFKHSSIIKLLHGILPLQCRLQTLSPLSVGPFSEAISPNTKAESAATLVSLRPQHVYLHPTTANVFLSIKYPLHYHHLPKDSCPALRACRRLWSSPSHTISGVTACRRTRIQDSEHVEGLQDTITAEYGQGKVEGPETGMPS